MISKETEQTIIATLLPYKPLRIGIFGSYARGEEKDGSDLDILVSFRQSPGLFELIDMEQTLSALLGTEIDLITENALKKRLRAYIERDLKIIYQ